MRFRIFSTHYFCDIAKVVKFAKWRAHKKMGFY